MECSDVLQRLEKLALGDLYGTEAARVMLHVKRCYTCREEYESIKDVLDRCREGLRHPQPVDRFDLLLERIAAEERLLESARALDARQATGVIFLTEWSKRTAKTLTAAAAAAVLVLSVGPRSNNTLFEPPLLTPAVLDSHPGHLLEPASAAESLLEAHRTNIERYLSLSSTGNDSSAAPNAVSPTAPEVTEEDPQERVPEE